MHFYLYLTKVRIICTYSKISLQKESKIGIKIIFDKDEQVGTSDNSCDLKFGDA
jgi:hypothetical protein